MSRRNVWRHTSQEVLFLFVFDARAALAFVPLMAHLRMSTFYFCIVVFVFFGLLSRVGFTLPIFLRFCRSSMAGKHREAIRWQKRPQATIQQMKETG